MKKYIPGICALFSFLLLVNPIKGQIGHGGTPEMNSEDFNASSVMYLLDPEDPIVIDGLKNKKFDSNTKALHYAIERPVDLSPEVNGEWLMQDGMSIWRAHLISPGAFSLGVLFSEFKLNKDAKIFLYSPDGKYIKGSYTAENNKEFGSFYVGHIPGDEVIIELQVTNRFRNYGSLRVGLLSHAFLPVYSVKGIADTGLGTSQDCELDVNCIEGKDWQTIKRAVCHINTPSLLCTGTLINNTSYNGKPYVLTAEHCINKAFYAEGSVFYFGYENSQCDTLDALLDKSVSGSTLMATGGTLDFTLLKLSTNPPREYNVYFSGWDAKSSNHTNVVTLHHPNGDAMKISNDVNTAKTASSTPGDLNDYLVESNYEIEEWDIGTTEGGSSGCPLFNSSKRLVGVLSGGLAWCGDSIGFDEENNRVIYSPDGNQYDYFSKLFYDWDHFEEGNKQLKKWLDPINSGQLSIGGLAMNSVDISDKRFANEGFRVFPNPSNGSLTLELPQYSGKLLSFGIYDLTGKLQHSNSISSIFPIQISLPELQSGIYIIRITGDNTNYSQRIMLK